MYKRQVESNIGGVLGYTDDYSGTYATISGTDVSLSVTYQSTDTNNTTNIGGVIGDVHSCLLYTSRCV